MNFEGPYRCIDIHSHHRQNDDYYRIISLDTRTFKPTARHDDPYSLGLHPWFIEEQDCGEALSKIEAALNDKNMLAVGECGLDKLTTAPMDLQESLFRAQLQLAEEACKPVMIHCVRAFNELIRIKKSGKMAAPWIIHGFNAKVQVAGQLLKCGCYLSFGKALLHAGSNASQALSITPMDRFFLETDEAVGLLGDIYAAAARIKRLDLDALKAQINTNFNRVFLHD